MHEKSFILIVLYYIAHSISGEGFNDLDIPDKEKLFEDKEFSDTDLVNFDQDWKYWIKTGNSSSDDENNATEKSAGK